MPNFYGVPEIDVQALAAKLRTQETFTILDVRELPELNLAQLKDDRVVVLPLSQLAQQQAQALPPALADKAHEIIVLCHHGNRSAQVTAWLRYQGWTNVHNLDGGIDAYAHEVDPTIGFY